MAKDKARTAVIRWQGDGTAYVPGAPMRDLLPDEWNALPEDVRRTAQASGLYSLAGDEAQPAQPVEEVNDASN